MKSMNSHQPSVVTLCTKALFITSVVTALFFIIGIQVAAAQTPGSFSTTWQTDNPGTSSSTAITIPTTGGGFNYTVYWEEVGTPGNNGTSTGLTGDATIDFPSAGTYRVDITGDFPEIFFDGAGDQEKILTIEQWGTIAWSSMYHAFYGTTNLTYEATDAPDLSSVIDLAGMFFGATAFNGNLDTWDVSNVVAMGDMFRDATSFNGTLNGWGSDIGSVTNMSAMFQGATSFNQPLDTWDVSSVTNMGNMFRDANSFDSALNGWGANTGIVTNMLSMFEGATSFNQPLDTWDVSSVTNMGNMFRDATAFNRPLEDWNVSSVVSMSSMFEGATNFNGALNGWGTTTASVTTMFDMFESAANFNQPLDNWDVSSVTNMNDMFQNSVNFNGALNGWGTTTASVTNMQSMFNGADSFNQPLDQWDVSSVTSMAFMFLDAGNFNSALNGWGTTTASVTSMFGMFEDASNFNQPLGTWDVSSTTNMNRLFQNAANFNQPIETWDVSSVNNMQAMFNGATNFNQPLGAWDIRNVPPTGLANTFDGTAWSKESYSATLEGWSAQGSTPPGLDLETTAQYLATAESARQMLISNGWTITDGGVYTAPPSGGSSGTRTRMPSTSQILPPAPPTSAPPTSEVPVDRDEILVRIAELEQLIVLLQTQAGMPVSPIPTDSEIPDDCFFSRDLMTGSSGEDVTCLQSYLTSTGDFSYSEGPTGYYGEVTRTAVRRWQERNEILPAAGYFGSISQRTSRSAYTK